MNATFTSNIGAWKADHDKAIDEALKDAALAYQLAVEARLSKGYKSGTFKTGKVAGSVFTTAPTTEKGVRLIRVGTKNFIARLWEMGHQNRFSRRFERVPVWRPLAVSKAKAMGAVFATTYRGRMRPWDSRASIRSRGAV